MSRQTDAHPTSTGRRLRPNRSRDRPARQQPSLKVCASVEGKHDGSMRCRAHESSLGGCRQLFSRSFSRGRPRSRANSASISSTEKGSLTFGVGSAGPVGSAGGADAASVSGARGGSGGGPADGAGGESDGCAARPGRAGRGGSPAAPAGAIGRRVASGAGGSCCGAGGSVCAGSAPAEGCAEGPARRAAVGRVGSRNASSSWRAISERTAASVGRGSRAGTAGAPGGSEGRAAVGDAPAGSRAGPAGGAGRSPGRVSVAARGSAARRASTAGRAGRAG
jgi:hypothetical protein